MRAPVTALWTALCAAITSSPAPALADSVSDFYRGKTVTVLIGNTAGGTYDLYARTIARHLGPHIPGTPSVSRTAMPCTRRANSLGLVA